jgi:hypothetical protein
LFDRQIRMLFGSWKQFMEFLEKNHQDK